MVSKHDGMGAGPGAAHARPRLARWNGNVAGATGRLVVSLFVRQVPLTPSRTVASVNVTVSRGGQTLTKSSKVLIEPPAFIHLIQTDKPIYKPGQTGTAPLR